MIEMSLRTFIIKVLVFILIKPPFGGRHSTTKCSYTYYSKRLFKEQGDIDIFIIK